MAFESFQIRRLGLVIWPYVLCGVLGCQTLTFERSSPWPGATRPQFLRQSDNGPNQHTARPRDTTTSVTGIVHIAPTLMACRHVVPLPEHDNDATVTPNDTESRDSLADHVAVLPISHDAARLPFTNAPWHWISRVSQITETSTGNAGQAQVGSVEPVFADPSWGYPLEPGQSDDRTAGVPGIAFRTDVSHLFPSLVDDAHAATNWHNLLALSVAAGVAIGVRQDLDGQVRRNTARHSHRWDDGSKALGKVGDYPVQVPVLFAAYGYSLWSQDEELHDLTLTSMNAYALTTATTLVIKAVANTKRPSQDWNGGQFGFPSYHTASSFSFAAVLDEYYGPKVGLPAYALAGLIGWSRIDERDHDLSDVLFGAALGYVVGKSVARHHRDEDACVQLMPYLDPIERAAGVVLQTSF